MKKRIVGVTGANGFIGRRLCTLLRACGDEVVGWDLPNVDLSHVDSVREAIGKVRPAVVFHLAATGLAHERAYDPAVVGENVCMSANVLEASAEFGEGTVVVLAGSLSEYGTAGVLSEGQRCEPTTAYGIAKLAVTNWAKAYGPSRGLRVRIGRLFGVYGPGEQPHRLFPMLLKNLRAGTPVSLSDGLQRRDFVHVDDVCEGLRRLARVKGHAPLVVNVGTGTALRVRDVAEWIAAALGASPDLLKFGARARSPGDADLISADATRLRELTGWVPEQRLHPGLDVAATLEC